MLYVSSLSRFMPHYSASLRKLLQLIRDNPIDKSVFFGGGGGSIFKWKTCTGVLGLNQTKGNSCMDLVGFCCVSMGFLPGSKTC